MSDPDDDIRSATTNTFASLVKMVPLEVCVSIAVYTLRFTSILRLVYPILPGSLRSC